VSSDEQQLVSSGSAGVAMCSVAERHGKGQVLGEIKQSAAVMATAAAALRAVGAAAASGTVPGRWRVCSFAGGRRVVHWCWSPLCLRCCRKGGRLFVCYGG
jgi:hypothetical protein